MILLLEEKCIIFRIINRSTLQQRTDDILESVWESEQQRLYPCAIFLITVVSRPLNFVMKGIIKDVDSFNYYCRINFLLIFPCLCSRVFFFLTRVYQANAVF